MLPFISITRIACRPIVVTILTTVGVLDYHLARHVTIHVSKNRLILPLNQKKSIRRIDVVLLIE